MVNEFFLESVRFAGVEAQVIDLSPRPGPASFRRRLSRFPKVLVGVIRLIRLVSRRSNVGVYVGVNGGLGQMYDAVLVGIARIASADLYLHHDSFAYLEGIHRVTRLVMRLAGSQATHIVLCDEMRDRLRDLYPLALRTVVISNVTNTEMPTATPRRRDRLTSIGFISNLTRAKGVLEFLDLAERVCRTHPEIGAILAGPVEERSLTPMLLARLKLAPWVKYVGPVYGEAKSSFLARLDVFIFPTRHLDEAEPKVVAEALAHGVVVIARDRGCLSTLLGATRGVVIEQERDFITAAERIISDWSRDATEFSSLSAAAIDGFHELRQSQGRRLAALIASMAGRT
jgi:glycosyltransferase involved in cell wall biosynthesis